MIDEIGTRKKILTRVHVISSNSQAHLPHVLLQTLRFAAFSSMASKPADKPAPTQPLVEVFGFPVDDESDDARRHRRDRICPYNNIVPSCTKDRVEDPLGVCSVYAGSTPTIICPVRFRERWRIVSDAAEFMFPANTKFTTLTEVKLNDADGRSAGNVDVVLVAYDEDQQVVDFGSLEVQGVYISGNLRQPFKSYMNLTEGKAGFSWKGQRNYPKPDYLSSSRKRLAPQLIYKGGIFHHWKKKMAVAIDRPFLKQLPGLPEVAPEDADVAWLVYELVRHDSTTPYRLDLFKTLYTKFAPVLERITMSKPGNQDDFKSVLQKRLATKLSMKIAAAEGDQVEIEELFENVTTAD